MDSTDKRKAVDKRVLNLASEVAETRDRRVPLLLLKLDAILASADAGSNEFAEICQDIWEYNLIQVLTLVLRQDYSIVEGQWTTGAKLVKILSRAAGGMNLSRREMQDFRETHLPRAIEHIFLLCRRILAQLSLTEPKLSASATKELQKNFQDILDCVVFLTGVHVNLVAEVLKSPWLLQLLITDDPVTVIAIVTMLDKVIRTYGVAVSQIDQKIVYSIMDELIYKLSVNNNPEIARAATKCVVRMCDCYRLLAEVLCTRYKGLRPLLGRWQGKGFGRDLKQLLVILDSGSSRQAEMVKFHQAAVQIQAVWKGFSTRRKLRKANKAFAKFQKTYRLKRDLMERTREQSKIESDLQYRLKMNRQRILREFKQKKLYLMEIMPAYQVERFLEKEKAVAIIKIQKVWRGHKERHLLPARQELSRQVKAAIKIQRTVRLWLERINKKKEDVPVSLKPAGLTDERRVELHKQIEEHREMYPTSRKTRDEVEEIHKKAAEMLHRHYVSVKSNRKAQLHRDALLARLETDSELILLAPSLKEVKEDDVYMYSSRSVPVMVKAKMNHKDILHKLSQPWWKRLGEEDDEAIEALQDEFDLMQF
ncbi:IQ calmodulin-binding motif-containing protein 1-like [Gigantopelta aegis]|uniref:IQ calmodulin-binding motif-containing protein 1-like n=1 Tax=Gigantopelta aegis TaxID=1735272 RepID=UPI001B88C8CA|nr:IQ calmodulin-binding motif-containing protein 1-like [Gigantopelta aegis]